MTIEQQWEGVVSHADWCARMMYGESKHPLTVLKRREVIEETKGYARDLALAAHDDACARCRRLNKEPEALRAALKPCEKRAQIVALGGGP